MLTNILIFFTVQAWHEMFALTFSDAQLAKANTNVCYLERSGGVPKPVLYDCRFCKEYFPIIRNDYSLVEHYRFNYRKVPCDIVAFASKEDREVHFENVRLMRFFTRHFELHQMKGSHFFIRQKSEQLGQMISDALLAG